MFFIQVPVSPGMKHDQRIPFRGQADQMVSYIEVMAIGNKVYIIMYMMPTEL